MIHEFFLKRVQLFEVEMGCFFDESLHLKLQSSHKYTDIFCVCMHRVLRQLIQLLISFAISQNL